MELRDALRHRRMTRSFTGAPVDQDLLDSLCVESLRAPTAGNAAGVAMVSVGPDFVDDYFTVATDESWRQRADRAPHLTRAGAVVLVTSEPSIYANRYREPDKVGSDLGEPANWPVPYWHTDAAMATMALLLLIEESGLSATMWGNFRYEREVLSWARCHPQVRLFAAVLVGHHAGSDRRSASLDRVVPTRRDRVRRYVGQ